MTNDNRLRQDVLNELEWDPVLHTTAIGVSAEDGVVTLMGAVRSYTEKWQAEHAAKRVRGVKGLVEHLDVELPSLSLRSDKDIGEAALNALTWHTAIADEGVRVVVEDGWLTLEGEVGSLYQQAAAENAVMNLTGVRGVSNNLHVKAALKPEAVGDAIDQALARNAHFDAKRIRAEVQGSNVVLRGHVHSWFERAEAERAAAAAAGVSSVENHITVEY